MDCSRAGRARLAVSTVSALVLLAAKCLAQTDQAGDVGAAATEPPAGPQLASILDVGIDMSPTTKHLGTVYVAANTPIQIKAEPIPQTNDSSLVYRWSTKDGPIQADQHASLVVHQFNKTDEDNFVLVEVREPKSNSSCSSRQDITVKSRLVVGDPVGKTFLEKGELLRISLVYSGSPPFKYCYRFCSDFDLLPCNFCFPSYETLNTTIPIVHYLHYVGNYTLLFQIANIMNYEEKFYAVKINDSVRPKSNLPIAPIVSSILAVVIIVTGVALHMRFKDASYATETANFDFFRDDDDEEWERELSLIQRIRYIFCGAEQDDDGETRCLIRKDAAGQANGQQGRPRADQQ